MNRPPQPSADATDADHWRSVLDLIGHWVRRTPDAPAAEYEGLRLSYSELDERADRMADELRARGVATESLVAILLDVGFDRLIAVLATLKAGGAYLPLDPALPTPRIQAMLDDAAPCLAILESADATRIDIRSAQTFLVDGSASSQRQFARAGGGEDADPSHAQVGPHDLAYVIYTSGSAGQPKGVELEHAGLAHMAAVHAKMFGVGPGSRVLQFFSFSFDAVVSEIFTTLAGGGTICMAPRARLAPGRELVELLEELAITEVLLPPSALAVMPYAPLPKLRTLISGGERCGADVVRRWAPGRRFLNAYGPTETTVTATFWECSPDDESDPPIGLVREGNMVQVLDGDMRPVTAGNPGELFVGGVGLARGYRGRPDLTRERFIANPFDSAPGARLYRTGDRVRQRADGALEFLGRVDRQVKVRGHRIELEEIEHYLRRQSGVDAAAVTFDEHKTIGGQLTAFCQVNGDGVAIIDSVRRAAGSVLPAAMIPARFVSVLHMPVTDRGKVDYQALARLAKTAWTESSSAAHSATRALTATEATLARIWTELLGLIRVGVDDHFVELGGDSLVSVQIALRAEASGFELSSSDVFAAPTVAKLARLADERRAGAR